MKIINGQNISSFGGLYLVLDALDKLSIGSILDSHLPSLPSQSRYSWRDIIYALWSIPLCGGDCIEDLDTHLSPTLSDMPSLSVPSPDRVLARLASLTQSGSHIRSPRAKAPHLLSHNLPLNALNLALLKATRTQDLENGILDFDNTLIFTNKKDATTTYKQNRGYCPAVGTMGNSVVYVENRKGHTAAHILQHQTLEQMFTLLKEQNIRIKAFRADSASYQLDTLSIIGQHVEKVYMRARMSESMASAIAQIKDWQPLVIDGQKVWRGQTTFIPFAPIAKRTRQTELLQPYRLIVTKEPRRDQQRNLFTGEAYTYACLITNDWEKHQDEVVCFYNQRGKAEREFDVLKNDFNWGRLPFSNIQQNTVYLIFMAMCRNLYNYIIHLFSRVYQHLSPHFRIKKFIFRFITIPAKWIYRARSHCLRIYGTLHRRA